MHKLTHWVALLLALMMLFSLSACTAAGDPDVQQPDSGLTDPDGGTRYERNLVCKIHALFAPLCLI